MTEKKIPALSQGATARQAAFDTKMREINANVGAAIGTIDSASAQEAVDAAMKLIQIRSDEVAQHHRVKAAADVVEVGALVRSHLGSLSKAKEKAAADSAALAAISPPNPVGVIFSTMYVFCFAMVFFTELKLTEPLAKLLGFAAADPAAKAMGAAFAATTAVFDLIFTKLHLLDDPYKLFGGLASDTAQTNSNKMGLSLRRSAAVILIFFSLGIAGLSTGTILRMAPTRPIAATVTERENTGLDPSLTEVERESVDRASLWFSLCILITGGYLLAAGYDGLKNATASTVARHTLKRSVHQREGNGHRMGAHLDEHELPALAGALASAGLSALGLVGAKPDAIERLLDEVASKGLANDCGVSAATAFRLEKEIALSKARTKIAPAPAKSEISWVDWANDQFRSAA